MLQLYYILFFIIYPKLFLIYLKVICLDLEFNGLPVILSLIIVIAYRLYRNRPEQT